MWVAMREWRMQMTAPTVGKTPKNRMDPHCMGSTEIEHRNPMNKDCAIFFQFTFKLHWVGQVLYTGGTLAIIASLYETPIMSISKFKDKMPLNLYSKAHLLIWIFVCYLFIKARCCESGCQICCNIKLLKLSCMLTNLESSWFSQLNPNTNYYYPSRLIELVINVHWYLVARKIQWPLVICDQCFCF